MNLRAPTDVGQAPGLRRTPWSGFACKPRAPLASQGQTPVVVGAAVNRAKSYFYMLDIVSLS